MILLEGNTVQKALHTLQGAEEKQIQKRLRNVAAEMTYVSQCFNAVPTVKMKLYDLPLKIGFQTRLVFC